MLLCSPESGPLVLWRISLLIALACPLLDSSVGLSQAKHLPENASLQARQTIISRERPRRVITLRKKSDDRRTWDKCFQWFRLKKALLS
jgi:hypothetical protein